MRALHSSRLQGHLCVPWLLRSACQQSFFPVGFAIIREGVTVVNGRGDADQQDVQPVPEARAD